MVLVIIIAMIPLVLPGLDPHRQCSLELLSRVKSGIIVCFLVKAILILLLQILSFSLVIGIIAACPFDFLRIVLVAVVLMTSGLVTHQLSGASYGMTNFIWYDCEPFRGCSSNLIFIVLEPLFDVNKVCIQSSLIPRVNHPNDKDEFQEAIDDTRRNIELNLSKEAFNMIKSRMYYPK